MFLRVSLLVLAAWAAMAQTAVKHIQTANSGIASAVWAGDTLYVSGQLPSPASAADPAKSTPAVWGDTKTQAANVFAKIAALLKEQGLGMGNVVMMHVYHGILVALRHRGWRALDQRASLSKPAKLWIAFRYGLL